MGLVCLEGDCSNSTKQCCSLDNEVMNVCNQRFEMSIDLRSCSSIYVPVVGQIFGSYDLAVSMYYKYGATIGFSINKGTTKMIEGMLVLRRFLYCKQGYSATKQPSPG